MPCAAQCRPQAQFRRPQVRPAGKQADGQAGGQGRNAAFRQKLWFRHRAGGTVEQHSQGRALAVPFPFQGGKGGKLAFDRLFESSSDAVRARRMVAAISRVR